MYLILKIISCWNVTATFKDKYLRGVVCRVRLQSVCPITVPGLPRLALLPDDVLVVLHEEVLLDVLEAVLLLPVGQ